MVTALAVIVELHDELEVTLTRQAVLGSRSESRSAETPLPFHTTASDVAGEVRGVLVAWCRLLIEEYGDPYPADTVPAIAGHLAGRAEVLRHHEAAPVAVAEITDLARRVQRVVDRLPERRYLGLCECEAVLTANPGDLHAACRVCGAVVDVEARRGAMLAALDDQLLTLADVVRAVSSLAEPIPLDTAKSWVHRGRLTGHGRDATGVALYRVGDVLDLLWDERARKARTA
jgi:hypothetical protein